MTQRVTPISKFVADAKSPSEASQERKKISNLKSQNNKVLQPANVSPKNSRNSGSGSPGRRFVIGSQKSTLRKPIGVYQAKAFDCKLRSSNVQSTKIRLKKKLPSSRQSSAGASDSSERVVTRLIREQDRKLEQ